MIHFDIFFGAGLAASTLIYHTIYGKKLIKKVKTILSDLLVILFLTESSIFVRKYFLCFF